MQPETHLALDRALSGHPAALEPGRAVVELRTTAAMAADAQGLVHGGFVFGAADHAAMLAVNEPNVVLGAAEVKFSAPVAVGDVVTCTASVTEDRGRKCVVLVTCTVDARTVLTGTFTCFVLDAHVLSGSGS
jgi:acyl-coenzyme A thioesterase PaaI-like protein